MFRLIYPGSFDPPHKGHLDLIARASVLADELIVAVLQNGDIAGQLSLEMRCKLLKQVCAGFDNVRVRTFRGALADFFSKEKATALLRGLRSADDFGYELPMTVVNRGLKADCETLFLAASPEYSYISSSLVRELLRLQKDVSPYVPECIVPELEDLYQEQAGKK